MHSFRAGWQSGYAAACKAVYAGSIPASASIQFDHKAQNDEKRSIILKHSLKPREL